MQAEDTPYKISFPAGISGFSLSKAQRKAPLSPLFGQFLSELVDNTDYKLLHHFDMANELNYSYQYAFLEKAGEQYVLLANKYFPFLALSQLTEPLAEPPKAGSIPQNLFTDDRDLQALAENAGFTVPPSAILRRKVDADEPESAFITQLLTDIEFAEFAYWEPKIMGDILFNNWNK